MRGFPQLLGHEVIKLKRIILPTSNTVSFTLTPADIEKQSILMPDGTKHVGMGNINREDFDTLRVARENGTSILWATICLEHKINRVITNYFLGPFQGPSSVRALFENEVVSSASFPLSFKKHLIDKISAELAGIDGRTRSKTQGLLKKILTWRNAFAHGSLQLDAKKGVLLKYYSGSNKIDVLNDAYWLEVENTFRTCDEYIKKMEIDSSPRP